MKQYHNVKGSLILSSAALIWGLALVAQTDASRHIPPFLISSLRSFIGAAFLFFLYLFQCKCRKLPLLPTDGTARKNSLLGGVLCGTFLTISINFQQFALLHYPDGTAVEARAGFLTTLYVIIVPLFSLFFGKKLSRGTWVAVLLAMAGIYLLCFGQGLSGIYLGDILLLLCALCFSFHIIAVDHFADRADMLLLSCLQFTVCGTLSGLLSLGMERTTVTAVVAAIPALLYLGILSCGIGYTLQIYGQRFAEPAVASISMSLESVFAALGGWLISGNRMTVREIFGSALMFAAILFIQLLETKAAEGADNAAAEHPKEHRKNHRED